MPAVGFACGGSEAELEQPPSAINPTAAHTAHDSLNIIDLREQRVAAAAPAYKLKTYNTPPGLVYFLISGVAPTTPRAAVGSVSETLGSAAAGSHPPTPA